MQLDFHLEMGWLDLARRRLLRLRHLWQGRRARSARDGRLRGQSHRPSKTGTPCCSSRRRICAACRRRTQCRDKCADRAAVERLHRRFGRRRKAFGSEPENSRSSAGVGSARSLRIFLSSGPRCRRARARRICRSRRSAFPPRPAAPGLVLPRGRAAAGENLRAVEQHARVDAEIPADQPDDDDCADAEAAGSARHAAAPARRASSAIVLDIVAGAKSSVCIARSPSRRHRVSTFNATYCTDRMKINQVLLGIYCLAEGRRKYSFSTLARHHPSSVVGPASPASVA